ncbi:MAG: site-specific integrase, partial [Planctomycetaceae bacterium]
MLALRWEDIAWQAKRFTVRSPKTEHHEGKGSRIVPLFPELAEVLTEGFEQALESIEAAGGAAGRRIVSGPVSTRYRDSTQNLRTTFGKILKRAGLKPWPKLLQNLRSTRETELAESFPLHAVTAWLGNSQLVA